MTDVLAKKSREQEKSAAAAASLLAKKNEDEEALKSQMARERKRIADLERELETRSGEVRELTNATLLLLRRKLDEEKQRDLWERFN